MPDLKTQLCSVTVFGMTSRLMLVVSCIVLVLFQVQPIYSQVLPVEDARVGEPKTLNTKWAFPHVSSAKAWKARAAAIRLQSKVSCGLYPMPERTPLTPIINGRIEHDKYTVENVSIQTLPGYFLYGNLYRPRLKDNKNRFLNNYLDIPIVNEYKYLGIYIDKNLNFKKQLEYMEKKMKKAEKIINIAHWKKIPIW